MIRALLLAALLATAAAAEDMSEFEEALSGSIAGAVDQGILQKVPGAELSEVDASGTPDSHVRVSKPARQGEPETDSPQQQRAESVYPEANCDAWPALDFLTASRDDATLEDLSAARRNFAEHDGEPEALRELVETYLLLTMGAEAKVLAADLPAPFAEPYTALATIIEDQPLNETQSTKLRTPCSAMEALWAIAALPDVEIDEPSVLPVFESLPPRLRLHLAGPMVLNAITSKQDELAEAFIADASRRPEPPSDQLLLARAKLSQLEGDATTALALLSQITDHDSTILSQALEARFELEKAAGKLETSNLADQFDDFYTRNPDRVDVAPLLVEALMAEGDYGEAVSVATSESVKEDLATKTRIWTAILTYEPPEAHLNTYIAALLSARHVVPMDTSLSDARQKAEQTLRDAGFSTVADIGGAEPSITLPALGESRLAHE
ncbi:hypothetical protein ACMA5I_00800 [Paracoccaceae bacterium GXU_MW_L88]